MVERGNGIIVEKICRYGQTFKAIYGGCNLNCVKACS